MQPAVERTINLGRGRVVPYPEPGSALATKIGKGNRRTGTKPEEDLRRELHGVGLRFRKDRLVRASGIRTHVDVVFGPTRLAVFVDGCFWHCCPTHFKMPGTNLDYWKPKFEANVERDRRLDAALTELGWTVLRIWEHEGARVAARLVIDELVSRGHPSAGRASSRLTASSRH